MHESLGMKKLCLSYLHFFLIKCVKFNANGIRNLEEVHPQSCYIVFVDKSMSNNQQSVSNTVTTSQQNFIYKGGGVNMYLSV